MSRYHPGVGTSLYLSGSIVKLEYLDVIGRKSYKQKSINDSEETTIVVGDLNL